MSESGRFALMANPGSRRALGFFTACRTRGLAEPVLIPWEEWLSPGYDRATALDGIDFLRIETPAESDAVERRLLTRGAAACELEGLYPFLPESKCAALPADEGELRHQRQWYLGWEAVLGDLAVRCESLRLRPMNSPGEIAVLFDKLATRVVLEPRGVSVPPTLGICRNFDDLLGRMETAGWQRVFLKPCHGSSASGVMAIARNSRGNWLATTSAVAVQTPAGCRIHNSKRLRRLTDLKEIRRTVDAVCRERALAERWFPKATLDGKSFDLRVLVIAGRAAHVAVRTSSSPVTNLHLHNRRGGVGDVIGALGSATWSKVMENAADAARAFPGCHYTGVDLMIGAGGRKQAVAEVNAFGDLLHHETWHGLDPWEAELSLW